MYKEKEENGISFHMLFVTLLFMSIIVILSFLKIYISNEIYYESRKANATIRKILVLKEEKIILLRDIEAIRFQLNVEGTIFYIKDN